MSDLIPSDYAEMLATVKARIRNAQYEALRAVNKELIALYWDIGAIIATRQLTNGRGSTVVEQLSRDLREEFPGISGFSVRNLWYMRDFYRAYGKTRNCNQWLQKSVERIISRQGRPHIEDIRVLCSVIR